MTRSRSAFMSKPAPPQTKKAPALGAPGLVVFVGAGFVWRSNLYLRTCEIVSGGPTRIRTWNRPVMSRRLLPLSYGPGTTLRRSSFEERSQLAASRRMTKLAGRLGFDLADPFARDRKTLSDLFQRVLAAIADPEPHLDDLFLAWRERLEHGFGLFLEIQVDDRFCWRKDWQVRHDGD